MGVVYPSVRGESAMHIHYLRRYRMEFDFARTPLPYAQLPADYRWVAWSRTAIGRHAAVKYVSFHSQIDSFVFPSLGNPTGCRRLMNEISGHREFLPVATWLIHHVGNESLNLAAGDCATIQGLVKPNQAGSIQNVGVTPDHRGMGLGRALMLQSLNGFRHAAMKRVFLDVTTDNEPAVELYKSIGFRILRTMYQAVDFEPDLPIRASYNRHPATALAGAH